MAGVEYDENGNLSFDPSKFALGFLGGAAGSKAASSGFKYMQKHPQLKNAVARELADALALGWQSARAKYPILSTLEPRYIVQNERGRQVQANAMIKDVVKLEKNKEALMNITLPTDSKPIKILRQDLRLRLRALSNTEITNIKTKMKARITNTGIGKIGSDKAIQKSINNGFSEAEHFESAKYIKELFENADFLSTNKDKNLSPDLKAIHRFESILMIGGRNAKAKITLKESMENGVKIYSLELQELSPL